MALGNEQVADQTRIWLVVGMRSNSMIWALKWTKMNKHTNFGKGGVLAVALYGSKVDFRAKSGCLKKIGGEKLVSKKM